MLQAALDRRVPRGRLAAEAVLTIALILGLGLAAGIVSPEARAGGTGGYGEFSLNLGSPWVPQLSGAIPPLRRYWIGRPQQVLGYPGLGVLMVWCAALPAVLRRRPDLRGHAALIGVLLLFTVFAVSNRITLGAHVLLRIPLPEQLAYALGAFRVSGRFFWPVAYAITAAAVLVLLRRVRPGPALAVLAAACIVQVVDTGPLRAAIAASASHPQPAALDRGRGAALLATARGVAMFPTTGCIAQAIADGAAPPAEEQRLLQATVELQLLASARNLPVNAAVVARLATDCAAEAAARRQPLRPGEVFFYLTGELPDKDQLGGRDPAEVCTALDWVRACRVPEE
jgi:hypothetical protein